MTAEPRLAGRLAAFLAAVAVLVPSQQPAFAQPPDQYISIVDQYANGDENGALKRLVSDSGRISSEVMARLRASTDRQVRSAIMLDTELAAVFLAHARPGDATLHINNARRLLGILSDDKRRAASERFTIRWYAFVTNLYAAQGLFVAALGISRDGWSTFPRATELAVARGSVYEMRGTIAVASRPVSASGRLSNDIGRNFEAAAAEYQRAIAADPRFAFAYLHLGWVHLQVGDRRAVSDLESALREAKDDEVRYLAQLFLGAAAERHGDLEDARRHFEAAQGLGPFQTAAVALSRVEMALGHADRARTITAAFAQLPDRAEDPWWNYQLGGFEPGAITWLRTEARRP